MSDYRIPRLLPSGSSDLLHARSLLLRVEAKEPSSPPSSLLLSPLTILTLSTSSIHPFPAAPIKSQSFSLSNKPPTKQTNFHSMATAPPLLPVSTAQPPPPSDTNVAPIANPSAFRSFILRISDSSRLALSQRRSWAELLDRSSFSRPSSISEATSRLRKNVPYYRINYLILVASVLALSLVTHPGSLLLILVLAAAWIFLYFFRPSDAPPISLFGRTFSDREIFGGLIALTVFVVFLTSVGSLIISAIMLGAALVAVHGSFHVPEDLFLDDQEPGANVGFLSFLGGIVPPAAAPPAVVAGR